MELNFSLSRCKLIAILRGVRPDEVVPIGAALDAGAAGFGVGSSIYRPGDSAEVVGTKAARLLAALRD